MSTYQNPAIKDAPAFTIHREFPAKLLNLPATELHEFLGGPALFQLEGKKTEPIFISVLLHGNETTGWYAIQEVLSQYHATSLPRSIWLFVGNVQAAAYNQRLLEGQSDYNRIWADGSSGEHKMAQDLLKILSKTPLFAAIDLHNNTGRNPHYACINKLENDFVQLARAFSSTIVYFTKPEGVISAAMAKLTRSVTLECGKPGEEGGVEHVRDFLLQLLEPRTEFLEMENSHFFHTVATVRIPDGLSFSFQPGDDLEFANDLDMYNFREMPAQTRIALAHSKQARLYAENEAGDDVSADYFLVENGQIVLRKPVMLSMLTLDARIIAQDCLCYLMEKMPVPRG